MPLKSNSFHRKHLAVVTLLSLLFSVWFGASAWGATTLVRELSEGENVAEGQLSNNGAVAYSLFGSSATSIYKGESIFVSGSDPDFGKISGDLEFNDSGTLVFFAFLPSTFTDGIFTGPNPDPNGPDGDGNYSGDTIIDANLAGVVGVDLDALNNLDDVLIRTAQGGFRRKLLVVPGAGQNRLELATQETDASVFESGTINDNRNAAWLRIENNGDRVHTIETRTYGASGNLGSTLQRLTVSGDYMGFGFDWSSVSSPSLSSLLIGNSDLVALRAAGQGGNAPGGLFTVSESGDVTAVVKNQFLDSSSGFSSLRPLSINDQDVVSFSAEFSGEVDGVQRSFRGVFLSSDLTKPVVATRHLIFPGWLAVELNVHDVNADGDVLAYARLFDETFTNERRVLIVADGSTDFEAPEGDSVFWSDSGGGNWSDSNNWQPQEVPSGNQWAVFDLDAGPYTVTPAAQAVGRAIIERGIVAFNGFLDLTSANVNAPSLTVGRDAIANARLRLNSGALLNTVNVAIAGRLSGGLSYLEVNAGAQLANTKQLLLGGTAGSATSMDELRVSGGGKVGTRDLIIGRGSAAATTTISGTGSEIRFEGELIVAEQGQGSLALMNGGKVNTDAGPTVTFRAGVGPGTDATITVDGAGSSIETALMGLGISGSALMSVTDGGTVTVSDTLGLGSGTTSDARLEVLGKSASEPNPTQVTVTNDVLLFGDAGHSEISIQRARMDIGGRLSIVGGNGSLDNTVFAVDAILGVDGDIEVGHDGALLVSEGATVDGASLAVDAADNGDTAQVSIQDSQFDVTGIVVIGNDTVTGDQSNGEGRVQLANGVLTATTVFVREGGRLEGVGEVNGNVSGDGEINVLPSLTPIPSRALSPQKGADANVLSINGDVALTAGPLRLAAEGPTSGDWGSLAVSGAADLAGTALRIDFAPGYAPIQGDRFPVLNVAGALTTNNLTLQYTGIEEGFAYQLNTTLEGNLEFEAVNNGVPFASDTIFRTSFSSEVIVVE